MGEFKGRRWRGAFRRSELYQLMLYMGMQRRLAPGWEVVGRLAYKNHVEVVHFDEVLFKRLLAMRPEYIRSKKRGKPENVKPLADRVA